MNTPYQSPTSQEALRLSGKKRLKSVAPLQAGIVLGALYAVLSLVIVLPMIPFVLLGVFSASESLDTGAMGGMGAGVGIGMLILFPIIYGVLGFIGGVIAAAVYNLIAKITGGLDFTLEDA